METLRKEEIHEEQAPVRHELKGRTLRANGLKFSAMEMGEGPEVVFCLHGFPDHARSFREQLPVLAEAGYRVIVPTLRGYEPSSQPRKGSYFLSQLAEDLLGWMDDLGMAGLVLAFIAQRLDAFEGGGKKGKGKKRKNMRKKKSKRQGNGVFAVS